MGWVLACEVIEPKLRAYSTIGMGIWVRREEGAWRSWDRVSGKVDVGVRVGGAGGVRPAGLALSHPRHDAPTLPHHPIRLVRLTVPFPFALPPQCLL